MPKRKDQGVGKRLPQVPKATLHMSLLRAHGGKLRQSDGKCPPTPPESFGGAQGGRVLGEGLRQLVFFQPGIFAALVTGPGFPAPGKRHALPLSGACSAWLGPGAKTNTRQAQLPPPRDGERGGGMPAAGPWAATRG